MSIPDIARSVPFPFRVELIKAGPRKGRGAPAAPAGGILLPDVLGLGISDPSEGSGVLPLGAPAGGSAAGESTPAPRARGRQPAAARGGGRRPAAPRTEGPSGGSSGGPPPPSRPSGSWMEGPYAEVIRDMVLGHAHKTLGAEYTGFTEEMGEDGKPKQVLGLVENADMSNHRPRNVYGTARRAAYELRVARESAHANGRLSLAHKRHRAIEHAWQKKVGDVFDSEIQRRFGNDFTGSDEQMAQLREAYSSDTNSPIHLHNLLRNFGHDPIIFHMDNPKGFAGDYTPDYSGSFGAIARESSRRAADMTGADKYHSVIVPAARDDISNLDKEAVSRAQQRQSGRPTTRQDIGAGVPMIDPSTGEIVEVSRRGSLANQGGGGRPSAGGGRPSGGGGFGAGGGGDRRPSGGGGWRAPTEFQGDERSEGGSSRYAGSNPPRSQSGSRPAGGVDVNTALQQLKQLKNRGVIDQQTYIESMMEIISHHSRGDDEDPVMRSLSSAMANADRIIKAFNGYDTGDPWNSASTQTSFSDNMSQEQNYDQALWNLANQQFPAMIESGKHKLGEWLDSLNSAEESSQGTPDSGSNSPKAKTVPPDPQSKGNQKIVPGTSTGNLGRKGSPAPITPRRVSNG